MAGNIYSLIHHELQYYLYRCDPVVVENKARIGFEIPKRSKVKLDIFDMMGNEIAIIVDNVPDSGYFEELIDCKELPTGKYIFKISAGGFKDEHSFFVIK